MSHLLNSGQIGILDKERNSNYHIHYRWEQLGFLEGLDESLSMKVALCYEVATNILLMEGKSCDIRFKMTGEIFDDDNRIATVIYPIIRRIVSKTPEACDYIPEIINTSKKHYNTTLCKALYDGDERYIRHFFNNILPKWSKYHRKREHHSYYEYKKAMYEKHVIRKSSYGQNVQTYEYFDCMDIEAEFTAAMADKIETDIKEHIKNKENETS